MINFDYGQVRAIQDLLRRNKAIYDEARLREWRERKAMGQEDRELTKYYLERETSDEQKRMEEETKA